MTDTTSIRSYVGSLFRGNWKLRKHEAISNIEFSLSAGEVVSVIGSNGAGKSTLLKIVAGILPPSRGEVRTQGTLAPMIELGAGFHPEMTAAENVVFFSSLLGRDIRKIKGHVGEVCAWAGLEEKMNFPLKTFSSGMIARLAFAVSTYFKPDILLVDEVLSVGDMEFQQKSSSRIRNLINHGTSILLVTHDLNQVRKISNRVIWMDQGRIMLIGSPEMVVSKYVESNKSILD